MGIFSRVWFTAISCALRMRAGVVKLKMPPTCPFLILASTSVLTTEPVVASPPVSRLSWPIFSSSVILDMRLVMKLFIFCSAAETGCFFWAKAVEAVRMRAKIYKEGAFILICLWYSQMLMFNKG
ncbi:hypothetical protein D3C86_1496570 [compost metagenome]